MDDFEVMGMDAKPAANHIDGGGEFTAGMSGFDGDVNAGVVPEADGGYVLPESWTGEGVGEELAAQVSDALAGDREEFMHICHASGLTDTQATALFDNVGKLLARTFSEDNAVYNANLEATVTRLWPDQTAKNIAIARRGAQFLKLGNELDREGLSANPLVLRMAHAVGRLVGEDAMRSPGQGKGALPSGEAARAEMLKVIASDAYRRNDASAIRKVQVLASRVSG